ncbi:MAG: hypothetical protein NC131_18585 [Roseburia sp.]|nr:hypothetical protein [Roseburia sp.]
MQYISGYLAFTQHADDNEMSCGVWNFSPDIYNNIEEYMRESDASRFKDEGIFKTMLMTMADSEMYYCANHARAYCDLLLEHEFKLLTGFYDKNIRDAATAHKIFSMCQHYALFEDKEILTFMVKEFGSNLRSYLLLYGYDKSLREVLDINL